MRLIVSTLLFFRALAGASTGISINGSANGSTVEQGLPVILALTSADAAPAGFPETLEALGLDEQRLQLVHRPGASSELSLGQKIVTHTAVWTLSPEKTTSVPAGTYRVQLPAGETASFVIAAPTGTSDSAEARATRLLLLSEYAELDGNSAGSLQLARQLVADQPESVAGKLRLSDLLADQGQLREALKLLDEAEMQFRRGKQPQPPVLIRARQAEILERMTSTR